MSVPPESLEVGKCYLAKGGRSQRIRRDVQILPDGRGLYEQRSSLTTWQTGIQYKTAFASSWSARSPAISRRRGVGESSRQ